MEKSTRGDGQQEFLRAALTLFYEKGYEKTTIKDLIEKAGLSKGAFYHYFHSKEDLLDAMAKEIAKRAILMMNEIRRRADLTALEKMNAIIEAINDHRGREEGKRSKIKRVSLFEENLKLEKRISKVLRERAVDFIEEIIQTAILEGAVETWNPRELAEFTLFMVLHLNTSIDELIFEQEDHVGERGKEEFLRELEKKLLFYEEIFQRVYQWRGGSIDLKETYVKKVIKSSNL